MGGVAESWHNTRRMEAPEDQQETVTVGVPRETVSGERRVALVPETVQKLSSTGTKVLIEAGAGQGSFLDDEAYRAASAEVVDGADVIFTRSDIVAKVQAPTEAEVGKIRPGVVLISFLDRGRDGAIIDALGKRGVVAFSFNSVPRITRAQSMDAMSSMSTVAGYKAVLLAANALGRFFPLLMTAAGTVKPARVFVIGAGVAGLQALATARRLGAVTEDFDTRPAVREQVQSVGADFIEMPSMEE